MNQKERSRLWYLAHKDLVSQRNKAWRAANPEKVRESSRKSGAKWRSANREKARADQRRWRKEHPEQIKAYVKKYHAKTEAYKKAHPEMMRACYAKYRKANPDKNSAQAARFRAIRLRATPSWANAFFIEEIYRLARIRSETTGFKWHVDHIIPLRSKLVCGLHVENNLQVIPAIQNFAKGNRHWPDMPEERPHVQ